MHVFSYIVNENTALIRIRLEEFKKNWSKMRVRRIPEQKVSQQTGEVETDTTRTWYAPPMYKPGEHEDKYCWHDPDVREWAWVDTGDGYELSSKAKELTRLDAYQWRRDHVYEHRHNSSYDTCNETHSTDHNPIPYIDLDDILVEVATMYADRCTQCEIAAYLGVSQSTVSRYMDDIRRIMGDGEENSESHDG